DDSPHQPKPTNAAKDDSSHQPNPTNAAKHAKDSKQQALIQSQLGGGWVATGSKPDPMEDLDPQGSFWAGLNKSPNIWESCKVFYLTINMRLRDPTISGRELIQMEEFSKWLLDMGAGRLPRFHLESVVSNTFPNIETKFSDVDYLKERCILCPTNDEIDTINLHVLKKFPGEIHELFSADDICLSTTNVEEMRALYAPKFLNTLQFSGIPNHVLQLGALIILMRFSFLKMNRAIISDLRPNMGNNWQVNVLVTRAWTAYNPTTNHFFSFDMILSDAQKKIHIHMSIYEGSSIHAKIPASLVQNYKNVIKLGCVYRIHKFYVNEYRGTPYRPLRCDILLRDQLNDDTYLTGHPSLVTTVSTEMHINLPAPEPVTIQTNEENNANFQITSISNIYSLLLSGDVKEGTMYNIDVNIIGVDLANDWKYGKYKLDLCVTNTCKEQMTCVLFNEAAISLRGMTVDDLVNRSLLEGADDPNWILYFLNDTLCAQRVILRIKIDDYNLPPRCADRFTVSKYLGHDINVLSQPSLVIVDNKQDGELTQSTVEIIANNNPDDTLCQSELEVTADKEQYVNLTQVEVEGIVSKEQEGNPSQAKINKLCVVNDQEGEAPQAKDEGVDNNVRGIVVLTKRMRLSTRKKR
ncbi:hypothetical protein M8C21_032115, partial [Ambrosia artemisiifolia]